MRALAFKVAVCAWFLLFSHSTTALAQSTAAKDILESKGLHANRNYFQFLPWERFDPVSGNVILSFTDLELPGNAGTTLRFQRTFNYQGAVYATGLLPDSTPRQWFFGIAGVPMRVYDPSSLQLANPTFTSFDLQVAYQTPQFLMADGGRRRTYYREAPIDNDADSQRWVVTGSMDLYNRQTHTLYTTAGIRAHFDWDGFLDGYVDAFGNAVSLQWPTNYVSGVDLPPVIRPA